MSNAKYAKAGAHYPSGTILVPLEEIGLDSELSQARNNDFNPAILIELEESIDTNGLLVPLGIIPTPVGSDCVALNTIVHGVHRYGRILKLNADKSQFNGGVPCIFETYSDLADLYKKQYAANAHMDKIHTKNGEEDAVRLIGRILREGTDSPMGSGLVWNTSIFTSNNKNDLASLFEEMSDFVNPAKSPLPFPASKFKPEIRARIVDTVWQNNGAPAMRQVRLYTNDWVKRELKAGKIIPNFSAAPSTIDGGKLVITMNANDYRAKPMSVIAKLMDEMGGKLTRFPVKPVKVVVVAYANKGDTSDKTLTTFRTNVETFIKSVNAFFEKQTGNAGFTQLIDELYFLPQKQNRTAGNETGLVTGTI
jgi:hypothetical protein